MVLVFKYVVLGISLAISIGPVNIELIKRGFTGGFLSSWLVGIGGMAADFFIFAVIYLGLGHYLSSDILQFIFGCIGSIMLAFMGYQNIRRFVLNKNDLKLPASGNERNSVLKGFLLAIANPFNLVFWSGIYSSILSDSASDAALPLQLIASIFIGITISNILFAAASSLGRSYVKLSTLRYITLMSGVILIGYGTWFGYTTALSMR